MCIATVVERSRTSLRPPGSTLVLVSILADEPSSASATVKQTVPTGLSSAIPVIATAVSAPKRCNAPAAMASATGSETAPNRSIRPDATPSSSVLAPFEYAATPPATYADEPGRSVSLAVSNPAVHDSATASRRPVKSPATCSSTEEPSSE